MGLLNGPAFVLSVFLCLNYGFAYLEVLAANADPSGLSVFEPEVAFMCNKPAMHRVVNGWEADFEKGCLKEPEEILEYCKKIYPDHDVKNVIEPSNKRVEIPDWPKFDNYNGPERNRTADHKVKTFKCLVDDFESEALLVPQHCVFDHKHNSDLCARPDNWTRSASEECEQRGMILESSGMLVVCGTDAFRGVEYVCCPKETKTLPLTITDDTDEDNEYSRYLKGDDMPKYTNEHKQFKAAEKNMQKKQHEKVTKMMKEWQEARDQVAEMRKNDKKGAEQLNKEITERFQRMYHAFVLEGQSEKKQLIALHLQRVQAMFNKRKRLLMADFKQELSSDHPKTSRIFSYLKQYIRTEEKDRLHMVNHFEHVRDTDQEEAEKIREATVVHLQLIDKRIEDAIAMLARDPELEKKVKPEITEFRNNKFRKLEISETDVIQPVSIDVNIETLPIESESESEDIESEGHDYTNIKIDTEGLIIQEDLDNKPYEAHAQSNGMAMETNAFSNNPAVMANYSTTNVVGIAIGSVAVFIIIVVAVVMLRKRSRRQPITHGFVEVDPAASPEERHVANMQMNGYENPTYRYFEMQN